MGDGEEAPSAGELRIGERTLRCGLLRQKGRGREPGQAEGAGGSQLSTSRPDRSPVGRGEGEAHAGDSEGACVCECACTRVQRAWLPGLTGGLARDVPWGAWHRLGGMGAPSERDQAGSCCIRGLEEMGSERRRQRWLKPGTEERNADSLGLLAPSAGTFCWHAGKVVVGDQLSGSGVAVEPQNSLVPFLGTTIK